MNKFLKCVVVNILLIFILLISTELFLCYEKYIRVEKRACLRQNKMFQYKNINVSNYFKFLIATYKHSFYGTRYNNFRNPSLINGSDKNAIILLGCSFTYGELLKEEQTISALLSKYTNRTVYNLGVGGQAQQTALFLLRDGFNDTNQNILKNNDNIEYVIYIYMYDHLRRLFSNVSSDNIPIYIPTNINGKQCLKFRQNYWFNFYRNTYIYRKVMELVYLINIKHNKQKVFDLFCLYMSEINREVKSKFNNNSQNTKFVVFVYNEVGFENWDKLRKEGITVIELNKLLKFDINSSKYKFIDGHPNEKAWNIIVPVLAQKLKL